MEINKNLYGDGSRNAHLRCETISCEYANKCTLYKDNKCKCVTVPFGGYCKFGSISKIDGGTKQGKKYYLLKEKIKADELYNKLEYPSDCYIYRVEDTIVLSPSYVRIKKSENGNYSFNTTLFGGNSYYMPIEEFTYDFLKKICSYYPKSLSGGIIYDYTEKIIPFMLIQLKGIMPKFYNGFITKYPKFNVAPNYIGKRAYLNTVNQNEECIYI